MATSSVEKEVKEAQRELWEAFFRHDIRKLDSLLMPEGYVHTDIDGNVFDKKAWIAWVTRGTPSPVTSYEVTDINVQFYRDTAVLTARLAIPGQQIRVTNVWVKQHGKWLRLAYQATRIAQ